MRVSSFPPYTSPYTPQSANSDARHPAHTSAFRPFSAEVFSEARARHLPVFLIIGDPAQSIPDDPSLSALLESCTIPVFLHPGERPDVEMLCQRTALLFSGEGALPLCALLLHDARPYLAAPLPPNSFPVDPLRLYAWLSHADRRLKQNPQAFVAQADQTLRSFKAPPLRKPYSAQDAAHDLRRALNDIHDSVNEGFGSIKSPFVSALCFLQHTAASGDKLSHRLLSNTFDAMFSSALFDPIDGAFFRSTLTEDWRVFIPEKPLGVNALLAQCLLSFGRRSEAIRLLDLIIDAFPLPSGGLSPMLQAPKETFSFSPDQVCAALGNEDGLRACRLLTLLHQLSREDPPVIPSRFSPVPPQTAGRRLSMDLPARYPTLVRDLSPEDAAYLRRALPVLGRARRARCVQKPLPYVLTEDCALSAAILAQCAAKLGESRYLQAARHAVSFLITQPSLPGGSGNLPAAMYPSSLLQAQATCGAAASLALAQLTLGQNEGMAEYASSGFQLLGAALHAFTTKEALVMYTAHDPTSPFPRMPAIYDSELPSPAAILVRALQLADKLRPQAGYMDAVQAIWEAAAPFVHGQPLACASLIDAMTEK